MAAAQPDRIVEGLERWEEHAKEELNREDDFDIPRLRMRQQYEVCSKTPQPETLENEP